MTEESNLASASFPAGISCKKSKKLDRDSNAKDCKSSPEDTTSNAN